ncbi:General stress protein 20U [bacterium HR19]|nr:General stress protein 20U [bacterium HR19]
MASSEGLGIDRKKAEEIIRILSDILANEFVLYVKARNYHWNVVGMNFIELHKLFEKIYEELNEFVDDIAERIRTLGGHPPSTLKEFLELAKLKEHPGTYPDAKTMIKNLLEDHEFIIKEVDKADIGTADLLTEILRSHEKTAWMLRSLLG